jgi:cell division transport system ATP-binding protein
MTILQFENVGLRYNPTKEILKDINLTIKKGEFLFLLGQSGAGKTSLLNLMHASLVPNRGFLNVLGYNVSNKLNSLQLSHIRKQIGFIFQDSKLINQLSVFDNIALPLKISKISIGEINNRVNELLHWIDLYDFKDAYPETLSGGQKQKVAIARAIINNPKLILADEPTGSIDDTTTQKIMMLLEELNKNGSTIIFATHNLDLVKNHNYKTLTIKNAQLKL